MPKALQKTDTHKEDMATPHGAINEEEAEHHRGMLQKAVLDLKENATGTEIKEIMGDFITDIKVCCEKIYPPLVNAEVKKVLHSLGDPYGLALREQSEEVETMLEAIMPEEDLPEPEEMVRWANSIEPLSEESKQTLIRMMEQLAEAHYQAGQAAQSMADLAKSCSPAQTMTILKFAARPLVQLEGTLGNTGLESNPRRRRRDLPEDIEARVNTTLLPNPEADSLKRESANSPTLLLAAIVYYHIKKNLGGGCTQMVLTSKFGLKPKLVSLCITGKKYRGGKDAPKATKRKATGSPTASTSTQ